MGLADALVSNPPLLILDEPTAGLNPNQIRDVRKLLRKLGKEHTVLLSTHILSEVESTCTRAVVISKGKLVAEGTVEESASSEARVSSPSWSAGTLPRRRPRSRDWSSSRRIEVEAGDTPTLRCTWKADAQAEEGAERAIAALVGAGIAVQSAAPEQGTLEDVFAELTR